MKPGIVRKDIELEYAPTAGGAADYPPVCCVLQDTIKKGMYIRVWVHGPQNAVVGIFDPNGKLVASKGVIMRAAYLAAKASLPGTYVIKYIPPMGAREIQKTVFVQDETVEMAKLIVTTDPPGAKCDLYPAGWPNWKSTPAEYDLAPGIWELEITPAFGSPEDFTHFPDMFAVELASGETKEVHRLLTKKTKKEDMYCWVSTCPHGASVSLNEDVKGTTPLCAHPMAPGKDILKVSCPGYHTVSWKPRCYYMVFPLWPADKKACSLCTTETECGNNGCYWNEGVCSDRPQEKYVPRGRKWSPIPPGVRIGKVGGSSWGTLGCVVIKNGKKMMLSNNHVLLSAGAEVFQGPSSNKVGKVTEVIPYESVNEVDCALAEPYKQENLIPNIIIHDTKYDPSYIPVGMATITPKSHIKKSGARTGYTTGVVTATGATVEVEGKIFDDVIIATRLADDGDSGSLGLDMNNKAFGLLFAGNLFQTIFCRIDKVLNKLGCKLYLGGEIPPVTPPPVEPKKSYLDCSTNPTGASIWLKKR